MIEGASGSRREKLEFLAVRLLMGIAGRVPWRHTLSVGRLLAPLAMALDPKRRAIGLQNLEMALGPSLAAHGGARRLLESVYANLIATAIELAHLRRMSAEEIRACVRYEGLERFTALRSAGRPVVILTGHVGNFDLMALSHSVLGHPLSFLARPMDNPFLYDHLNDMRIRFGNQVLDKKGSGREAFRVLRAGGVLGILGDQNATREEGEFVEFFGLQASTHVSIAKLALKTGSVIVPAFISRDGGGRHTIHVGDPIEPRDSGLAREDAVATTQEVAKVTEAFIRRFPDQWFWVHRRWKTRPQGEARFY